jgi:hypothetical protein
MALFVCCNSSFDVEKVFYEIFIRKRARGNVSVLVVSKCILNKYFKSTWSERQTRHTVRIGDARAATLDQNSDIQLNFSLVQPFDGAAAWAGRCA